MRGITTQFIRQLSAAANQRTDGELLNGFLTHNTEVDFAELVHRYGSMVWAVCRRALPDQADAEDAFQTVFLVLVRRGNKLISYSTFGPWLHRVAVWTCRNIRRRNARRLSKRESLTEAIPATATDRDLPIDLDNALLALPEKFRSSIVLCHLLGFSRADAAAQLGCPEGTLSAWLSRGMAKLRTKLSDLDPARILGITAVAVPSGLSASVVRAAVAFHTTAAISAGISSAIPQLVEGVIRMLWIKKATAASIALFAMFAFGVGVGVSTFQIAPAADGQDNTARGKTVAPAEMPQALQDTPETSRTAAILERLEAQLQKAGDDYLKAMERVKVAQEKVVQNAKGVAPQKIDKKQLEKALYELTIEQAQAQEMAWFRDKIKESIAQIKEATSKKLKAKVNEETAYEDPVPKKVEPKTPPTTPDELDKRLAQLRAMYEKLLVEQNITNEASDKLERTMRAIRREITDLQKEKETNAKGAVPTKPTGGYFQLNVETKDTAWPFAIKEFGPDGKLIGTTAFDNSAALGRYLARAMKDSTAPKEVRISAHKDTPWDVLACALEACKAAGVAQIYFENANPKKQLAEWLDFTEKPKNAVEKEKNYPHVINDLWSKKHAETQKLQQQEEKEKNDRDAALKALEWFHKRMANEPPIPPKP